MTGTQIEDLAGSDATVTPRASKVRRVDGTRGQTHNRMTSNSNSWEVDGSDTDQDNSSEGSSGEDDELSDEEFGDDDFSYVEGDELYQESLDKIQRNDPDFSSLSICQFSDQIDWNEAEHFIGENTSLKTMYIKGDLMEDNSRTVECFGRLGMGLKSNRSIEHLSLIECAVPGGVALMANVTPCLENNVNLRRIEFIGCAIGDEGARLLNSALSNSPNKHLLQGVIFDANEIGDQSGKELIEALRGYGNLEELSLGDNELGQGSCTALKDLLLNSTLKKLNLENNCIDDTGIQELTVALSGDTALVDLNLSLNCAITQAGWQLFSRCLRQPNSKIKNLDLSSTNLSNEGVSALGHSLANNTTLSTLSLIDLKSEGSPLITSAGWQSFFKCTQSKESGLRKIDLRYNSIAEKSLPALASALSCNLSLKVLCLSNNDQITVEGWRSFFTCLRRTNFSIEELDLCGNKISDEVISDLTGALFQNQTLKSLALEDVSLSITNRGWSHLSRLLCDKSSLMSMYNSNHSLCHVYHDSVPREIRSLLSLNEGSSKKDVARRKLLRYHFQGAKNTHDMLSLNVKVMPQALSWIGKDVCGHDLIYDVLRSLPSLIPRESKIKISGVKRRRID